MKNIDNLRSLLLQFLITVYLFFGILFQIVGGKTSFLLEDTICSKNPVARPLFLTYSKISRHFAPNFLNTFSDGESVAEYSCLFPLPSETLFNIELIHYNDAPINYPSNKSPPSKKYLTA